MSIRELIRDVVGNLSSRRASRRSRSVVVEPLESRAQLAASVGVLKDIKLERTAVPFQQVRVPSLFHSADGVTSPRITDPLAAKSGGRTERGEHAIVHGRPNWCSEQHFGRLPRRQRQTLLFRDKSGRDSKSLCV